MKKLSIKLLILFILPLIPFMGITNAQFYDLEESSMNTFTTSTLDFELRSSDGIELIDSFFDQKIRKNTEITKTVRVVNTGSLTFEYWPQFEFKGGQSDVCEELVLTASLGGIEKYSGSLSDFNLASSSSNLNGNEDVWEFLVHHEIENEELQGEYCEFNIRFSGYQNASTQSGFSDTEILTNKITVAYEPTLTLTHDKTNKKLVIELNNLSNFTSFDYEASYDTDTIQDGFIGSETLNNDTQKTIERYLGICSSNGTCVPFSNPHNFSIKVDLVDIDGLHVVLTDQL